MGLWLKQQVVQPAANTSDTYYNDSWFHVQYALVGYRHNWTDKSQRRLYLVAHKGKC